VKAPPNRDHQRVQGKRQYTRTILMGGKEFFPITRVAMGSTTAAATGLKAPPQTPTN